LEEHILEAEKDVVAAILIRDEKVLIDVQTMILWQAYWSFLVGR
jgi:hypothetical protein